MCFIYVILMLSLYSTSYFLKKSLIFFAKMSQRKTKLFCFILSCPNHSGSEAEVMFRSPSAYQNETRLKWIKSIKTHQEVIGNQNYFLCRRHFSEECFKPNTKKVSLTSGSVPTIFDSLIESQQNDDQNNENERLISEINSLKKELSGVRTQCNIDKQVLQMRMDGLTEKIINCNATIDELKKKSQVEAKEKKKLNKELTELQNEANSLKQNTIQNEIISCLRNGNSARIKYSEVVRAFCFKLHYYSPRAYEFVRSVFNNNLPHVSTIKSWYRNSNVDSEPGINQCSLKILERTALEMKENKQQLVCSLTFDEMSIRKHIQWCSKTKMFLGNVTYGDKSKNAIANNAIAFLVNGMNAKIQVPIAYHFITALSGKERMNILLEIIAEVFKRGVIISNITFDGLGANKLMCELLGASLKSNDMNTYFVEPYSKRKIYIILDPSHCIKLVRNNLFNRKMLIDANGGKIKWRYFQTLVEFGKKNDFGLTHKITNRHIDFKNRKMHVRTAVQTLSNSVANSLEYLMKQNTRGFANANATVQFIRIFNNLFDIMNTRTVNHSQSNQFSVCFSHGGEKLYFGLKVRGEKSCKMVRVVTSRIQTGFRGFMINIDSVIGMYREFVEERHFMHMIATYKLSQDHIEMLFSKIRSVHRCNDNPTVQQFKSSYKRLQMASDILISSDANISSFTSGVSTNLLTISSAS